MIKPRRLAPGDTIAVLSPSGGAASAFPDIYRGGVDFIESRLGLKVKEYPSVGMSRGELWRNPRLRADDLNSAFADREVRAIVSTIGGDDAVRILEHLDLDLIMRNPKIIMGYSDSTAFLAYLNMHGLETCHGPSVMAGFAYLKNFPEALDETTRVLFEDCEYSLEAFPAWAEKYRDWNFTENVGEVQEIFSVDTGHHWINKGPLSSGRLWGGCIEILEMMNGSFAWPGRDFFKDRVLFLETSEDRPTPEHVSYVLRNLGLQGVLGQIRGLLIARPAGYSLDEKTCLEEKVRMIVVEEWGRDDLSIVMNMDFGHTEPRHILPYGIELEIDAVNETMRFTEPIFADR